MKKIICLFIFMSIVLTVLPYNFSYGASKVEMIFNETFEGDLSRWTASGIDGVKNTEIFDTEKSYTLNCALIYDRGDGTNCILKSETFDVEPNNKYTIAVDMKSENNAQTRAHLVFLNKYGGKLENGDFIVGGYGNGSWFCASEWIKAPEDAYKAQVWLDYQKTDTSEDFGYFDNVIVCKGLVGFNKNFKLRKESSPLAYDDSYSVLKKEKILFYDNFESGFNGWKPINENSEKIIVTGNKASTGVKSLKMKNNSSKYDIGVENGFINIVPDSEYTFSCDINNVYGSDVAVYINFFDMFKKEISGVKINSENSGWQRKSIEIKSPVDALYAKAVIIQGANKESYVDNIKLTGEKGTGNIFDYKPKYDIVFNNSIILSVDKHTGFVNGKAIKIDNPDNNIKPLIKNGRTMVPVRFIAESFGMDVLWEESTKTVTLLSPDKKAVMVLGEEIIKTDNGEIASDVVPFTHNQRTYLPLRVLSEKIMEKSVFWDDRGLIVISDMEFISEEDKEIADKLIESIKMLD